MPTHEQARNQTGRTGDAGFDNATSVGSRPKANGRAHANGHAHHAAAPFDHAADLLRANGYSPVALVRKIPIDKDWTRWCHVVPTPEEITVRKSRGHNVGVAMGYKQTVALDIDTDDAEINAAIRSVIAESNVAKRGQRGRTDCYRTPGAPPPSRRFVSKDGEILVELLSTGRQSAIPSSIHPDTQQPYVWLTPATLLDTPAEDLAMCPADLTERLQRALKPWLKDEPERAPRAGPPPILTEAMRKRQRALALKKLDGRVKDLTVKQKPGRDRALFNLVCGLGVFVHKGIITDAELSAPALAACETNGLIKTNSRRDCEKTIDNGLRYALGDVLEDLPDRMSRKTNGAKSRQHTPGQEAPPPEPEPADDDFDRTASGAIAKSEGNIRRALAKAGIKLSYDAFARQRIIRGLASHGPDLTDAAIDAMWIRFEREHRVRFGREHFNTVVRVEAYAKSYHPVRAYLAGIKWDGQECLNKWLVTYAGAEDTEINHQFGRLALIAAVRRIRHPGTKFDAMLVLEGPEGRNKSTLFETLASPEWFSDDAPLNAEARETIERLRGKWIIEAADLSAVKRADVERLKAFLSRSKDTATLKFERETTTAMRECIFVGTTNSSEYLQSKTGNRRFWPVKTGTIDLAALRRDRDQIWAEAAHQEAEGASIMLPEKFWSVAAEEQEKRRESDVWEGEIGAWLDLRRSDAKPWVSPAEVARAVLKVHLKDLDGQFQRRIYEAMRLAGWSKDDGKIVRGNRLWGPNKR